MKVGVASYIANIIPSSLATVNIPIMYYSIMLALTIITVICSYNYIVCSTHILS